MKRVHSLGPNSEFNCTCRVQFHVNSGPMSPRQSLLKGTHSSASPHSLSQATYVQPKCKCILKRVDLKPWGRSSRCPHWQPSSVQSLSRAQLFATPGAAARQASLSFTNSWSLLKLMSIGSVMPSNHLILCRPLLLLPSIFPSIRVFSDESVLLIRWLKYWSFSFSISPSNEYSGLISFRMG